MDQQTPAAKKLSLLEYKKNREASNVSTAASISLPIPLTITNQSSPQPIIIDQYEGVEAEKQQIISEIDLKLNSVLDKGMNLIEEKVMQIPALMRGEGRDMGKLCYLNFILKLNVIDRVKGFGESNMLRDVVYNWLKICSSHQEEGSSSNKEASIERPFNKQVLLLILDLVKKINFSEEYLKNSKFLKIITKICDFESEDVRLKAGELYHVWNKKVLASKYLTSTSGSGSREAKSITLNNTAIKNSSPEIFPVNQNISSKSTGRLLSGGPEREKSSSRENTDLFGNHRQSNYSTTTHPNIPNHNISRPISVDEIVREKKRKMLLLESQEKEQKKQQQQLTNHDSVSKKQPKKRVSFAPEELLVHIKYFEIDDDNSVSHRGRASYHETERQEASFAFKKLLLRDQPQINWKNPTQEVEIPPECIIKWGSQSAEIKIQEERERTVLSVTYYSLQHIPPSPTEPPTKDADEKIIPDSLVPPIPLYEVQSQPQQNTPSLDPNALVSLMQNPDLMKALQMINK